MPQFELCKKKSDPIHHFFVAPRFDCGYKRVIATSSKEATMFYSAKSSAVRAARKSGLVEFTVNETPMGWTFAAPAPVKTMSHKELAAKSPARSVVEKPVDYVWTFVRQNPDMPRKLVLKTLVEHGVNIGTATTQYHYCKAGYPRFKVKANDRTSNA